MNEPDFDRRIDEFIDAVTKVARGDYSVQLALSDKNNKLDALAIGINMMVDDLRKGRETELENDRIRQINIQLEEAKTRAMESDRLKTVFLQNISHEIRTPLNAIIGFSDLLGKHFNDKGKLTKFSSIIKQRGADLLDLINDLLDLSRIETGQLAINPEDCDLSEFFDDLHLFFSNHKQKIGKGHINLHYTVCGSRHEIINTDKGKLKQIFVNLIYNALKFTDSGRIDFGCSINENGKIEYYVSDTGIGIPPEKHAMVFDRFMQLNHDTENGTKGTGLGLSIVKGLIELLGGTITLKSNVGEGSTFCFTIPYQLVSAVENSEEHLGEVSRIDCGKYNILIVEDDVYNAQYLEEVLADTGINILKVTNARDAFNVINSNKHIDLILMDIGLPGIGGLEAIRIIKKSDPKIRIIVQTAYTSNEDRKSAFIRCDILHPAFQRIYISILRIQLYKSGNE